MTALFGRQFSLIVGTPGGSALELGHLRCVFSIRRGDYQNPNSCDVRIYNLSTSTSNRIAGNVNPEFTQLAISAGYGSTGTFGKLFQGTIKQRRVGRLDQKDTFIDLTAADGDEAYNFSTMALTLAATSTPAAGLLGLIQAMAKSGIGAPTQLPEMPATQYVRGRVFYGMTRDEIRSFAKAYGFKWSIQDGVLQFVPITGFIPGNVPVISPQTGLIGVPEQTQNGIELRTLINPSIKIGSCIKLVSNAINKYRFGLDNASQDANLALAKQIVTNADGLYYVMVANHHGDTRGNDFYSELTCLAVNATVTQQTAPGAPLPEGAVLSY